jgi:predicted transcriptional regulator YdeE
MQQLQIAGMKGKLTKVKPFRALGIMVEAPFDELGVAVPAAKDQLRELAAAIPGLEEPENIYCISRAEDIGPAEENFNVFVCLKASEETPTPDGLEVMDIPSQRCVFVTYRGPMAECVDMYKSLFAFLKKGNPVKLDTTGYRIEIYDENHDWKDKKTPKNRLHICVPVV